MSFVSVSFAALYLVAIGLRLSIGRSGRSPGFLLALYGLSLTFYAWHVPAYLALIGLSGADLEPPGDAQHQVRVGLGHVGVRV